MKKIFILGADTLIGWNIYKFLRRETNNTIYPVIHKYKANPEGNKNLIKVEDIFNKKNIKKLILSYNPDVIINAMFDINKYSENDQKQQFWSNNAGYVENIARASLINESQFITFSSEKVFDGLNGPYTEESIQLPNTFMGKTMLAIENMQKSIFHNMTIFRLTEYYGYSPFGFGFILDNIFDYKKIEVEGNVFSNPIYVEDIAIACYKAIENNTKGIYNLGGKTTMSRYEFIKTILDNNYFFNFNLLKEINPNIQKNYGLINLKATVHFSMDFTSIIDGSSIIQLFRKSHKSKFQNKI